MKNSRETVGQRQREILRMLKENGSVTVEALAEKLGVSLMTIRRDLQDLEKRRLLLRTHGGAVPGRKGGDETEETLIGRCRRDISKYAASFINDGDILFINGSRTALGLLEFAEARKTTVYTNNCWALKQDWPENVTLMLTGGEVRSNVMIGEYVMRNLLELNADRTFMGCAAVYEDAEFCYDIPTEIGINELMVSRTRKEVFILADHSKLQKRDAKENAYGSCSYDSPITLITDVYADRGIVEKLRNQGIKVLIAPEEE